MRYSIYWSFIWLLMSGCVSVAKHEQLEKQYESAHAELRATKEQNRASQEQAQAREREMEGLSEALDVARAQVAKLELGHSDDVAQLATQTAENERLNRELAEVLKHKARLKQSTD
jgi:uncharacterized protein YceK